MSAELTLPTLVGLVADCLRDVDSSGTPYRSAKPPFREYAPGVGPYSETQLVRQLAERLPKKSPVLCAGSCTKRFPDLLIPSQWAIEAKIARPFGDNGKEAEHWSQNLLHPYPGNVSVLADAMKLAQHPGPERRAVLVIGYEHSPPRINLDPLIKAFELIAAKVIAQTLVDRTESIVEGLTHPVHQRARIWGWEVLGINP